MSHLPRQPWTAPQKIAFRWCFLFLSLQFLTENFFGNLFGYTLSIWTLGERVFVPPCLWLNMHFFHFKYKPESWTTFSGGLHTIRDAMYLGVSCLACVLWTIFDQKRASYYKLQYWFSQCLVVGLSAIFFAYGIIKLIPVQMNAPSFTDLQRPLGDLSPFDLLWATFGYGKPYQVFSGLFEVTGAFLILSRRTRVAGLLIMIPVLLNVILLNYTYQIGVLLLSFYLLLMAGFLLAPYTRKLFLFFFTKKPVALSRNEYLPDRDLTRRLLKILAILFLGYSLLSNTRASFNRYVRNQKTNASRQTSLVRHYTVDKDTLPLIDNDTICWKIWSERISNGKRSVTIAPMNPEAAKTYTIERDSSHHQLVLHPINQPDTAALHFTYTAIDPSHWRLEGTLRQRSVKVDLQKINPDTVSNLLKTKRIVLITDDE